MQVYRILIIDDERLAREEIKQHLAGYSDFAVAGEAADADTAEGLINELKPDLLFLDIQMPERSGIDLLESLETVPEVIFTTAYDQYAVKAFELNALDYLLKPIRSERFDQAVARVRSHFNSTAATPSLFVKEGDRYHFIRISDIYLIESAGNYACLYSGNRKFYVKRSLNQLEKSLNAHSFFRINRTELINTGYIKQLLSLPKGKINVVLQNERILEVSGRQSSALRSKLGI